MRVFRTTAIKNPQNPADDLDHMPEFLFIDRQSHVIEAKVGDKLKVAAGDPGLPRLPAEILGEPLAEIGSAMDDEAGWVGWSSNGRRSGCDQ